MGSGSSRPTTDPAPRSRMYRSLVLTPVALTLALVPAACSTGGESSGEQAATQQQNQDRQQPGTTGSQVPGETQPRRESEMPTGTIVGRATDKSSGRPLSNVYIVVGYQGIQRAAITGPDGRYVVVNVPAGEPASILGFHENNYRYHNSRFDAGVVPRVKPGETVEYDFTVLELNDPAGQPEVSNPAIGTTTARPGDRVEFALTVTGGEGGLSEEVFASSPKLGRVAWLRPIGGNRYRGSLAIPRDTPPGEYPFAYFAASNKCYDPEKFPLRVLRVVGA